MFFWIFVMMGAKVEPKIELESLITADCPSCKTVGAKFDYRGPMTFSEEFISKLGGIEALKAKYGSLDLYGCGSCKTSMTLKSLLDYKN